MDEMSILKRGMLAVAGISTLFRQNVGMGWTGTVQHFQKMTQVFVGPGDVVIRKARPLHAGLVKGSGDLVGWTPVTVDERLVGRRLAVFTSAEAKAQAGRVSPEQANFMEQVKIAGGIAGVFRNDGEIVDLVSNFN